jgi:hypothetical protein
MKNETFEIIIRVYGSNTKYRMQVEVIYRSDQVVRFKVSAGERFVIMEKILVRKTNNWKMKESSFIMSGDPKNAAQAILTIQNELDDYLNPPTQRKY